MPSPRPRVKSALYLDAEQLDKLRKLAAKRDTPLSRLIRKALDEFLARNPA